MCRGCMRRRHKENPFHRIELWNGNFFRPAELWEVGAYLLIRHHTRTPSCNIINSQVEFLDMMEERNDVAEQEKFNQTPASTSRSEDTSSANISPFRAQSHVQFDEDIEMSHISVGFETDNLSDEEFLRYIQELQDGDDGQDSSEEIKNQFGGDVEDDLEEDESEVPIRNQYLPHNLGAGDQTQDGNHSAQRVMGTYVRVVHTNGIHNIAMISCSCQGPDHLANDLIAARLLPASFERIRTIFTSDVLNYFRLSNLELKATAYQFYHLLQRITNPLEPASVVNLYREFRRMTRIWCWMKRLKWAGYGMKKAPASEVTPGQLSVFCPACPQPGINIPDNWKDNQARYPPYYSFKNSDTYFFRWVYKRIFVADGNFKADHVRQKSAIENVWLSEGGGMVPKREEYQAFLKTAIERLTVSLH